MLEKKDLTVWKSGKGDIVSFKIRAPSPGLIADHKPAEWSTNRPRCRKTGRREDGPANTRSQSDLFEVLPRSQKVSSGAPARTPMPILWLNSDGLCSPPRLRNTVLRDEAHIPSPHNSPHSWGASKTHFQTGAKRGWTCVVFWEMKFACQAGPTAWRRDAALHVPLRAVRWAVHCCPHVAAECVRPVSGMVPKLGCRDLAPVSSCEPLGIPSGFPNVEGWGEVKKLGWRN